MDPVGQHRLETGQPLCVGLPDPLIGYHTSGLAGSGTVLVKDRCVHREDFPLISALPKGLGRPLLGPQPPSIDLLPGDTPVGGDPLGGFELVGAVPREVVRLRGPGTVEDVGAEAHVAHQLDPAGQPHVDGPRGDQGVDQVVGLLAGSALGVDCGGRRGVVVAGGQPGVAGHVAGLFAGLGHASSDDLLHLGRFQGGLIDDAPLEGAQQLGGVEAAQVAGSLPASPDRRP